jgi:hypothetical protein
MFLPKTPGGLIIGIGKRENALAKKICKKKIRQVGTCLMLDEY